MDKKYSAYICTGCGIGEALDIEALSKIASNEMAMDCKEHACLCGADGRAFIEKDMNENGVNTIVVCACSPRVMQNELTFGDDKITVRVNLREQVIWSAGTPDEGKEDSHKEWLQETASDYVRMGCTRAKKTELPEAFQLETMNKEILVMGGGIAGLTAALEASKAGSKVTIIEKADKLGGKALGWAKQFPTKLPYADLEENSIGAMAVKLWVGPSSSPPNCPMPIWRRIPSVLWWPQLRPMAISMSS